MIKFLLWVTIAMILIVLGVMTMPILVPLGVLLLFVRLLKAIW
jgi:hypothetical protein